MTQNLAGTQTHGDGSESQPGCNLDGKSTAGWPYDDSKLYLAKAAVIDTISAFGAAEFALATYSRTQLGQACSTNSDCTSQVAGAVCVDVPGDTSTQKYCAYHGGDSYLECASGAGCVGCANASDANDLVFDWGAFDCLYAKCSFAQGCIGGQVIVGFPTAGTSNLLDIYHWIDGKEDLPPFSPTSNRELRAVTMTPLASALDSVRAWLTDASTTNIGAGAGLLSSSAGARDPRAACRPYSIILITDGEDTCSPNSTGDPVTAAGAAYSAGIGVYVVGFGTGFSTTLNGMAMAGSGQTRSAYFPSNRADLTANLGDILLNAIPKPKCNCDATCYDEAAAFPLKGQPCQVGVGRCTRQGVYACNPAGDGVMCATAATCGATPLVAGTPVPEQCGTLAGCQAPTAADCADENCDGNIDEGLSCACSSKPEVCNGLDDNCNGIVDDIAPVPCGLNLGACKPGITACVSDGAGGQQVTCQGAVGPTAEVCDGIDNDCDGVVDQFARSCYPAGATGCTYDDAGKAWSCVGACATGMQVCSAGAWQPCVGAVTPTSEIACDGLDNNCDGRVDENNPLATDICYPAGTVGCDVASGKCVGQCAFGHYACAGNKMGLTCAGSRVPVAESCNGKDDDCDGQIDEDFPTLGQPCNEQSCQGAGQLVCNAAGTDVECTVTATGPSPEVCDGRDNDCDGLVDEPPGPGEPAMPGVGVVCGSNVGECKTGTSVCTGGKIVCNSVGPTPEICDGKDNDCNGSIDDGVVLPGDELQSRGHDARAIHGRRVPAWDLRVQRQRGLEVSRRGRAGARDLRWQGQRLRRADRQQRQLCRRLHLRGRPVRSDLRRGRRAVSVPGRSHLQERGVHRQGLRAEALCDWHDLPQRRHLRGSVCGRQLPVRCQLRERRLRRLLLQGLRARAIVYRPPVRGGSVRRQNLRGRSAVQRGCLRAELRRRVVWHGTGVLARHLHQGAVLADLR